jgi:broad specificity phosphatase PhoE
MKPTPHNIAADKLALYERLLATNPAIERKEAANPYTAVNGHMFSLLGPTGTVALRLAKEGREQFLKKYKTVLFVSHGHTMPEFVAVPDSLLKNTKALTAYLEASYVWVAGLKPKPARRKS